MPSAIRRAFSILGAILILSPFAFAQPAPRPPIVVKVVDSTSGELVDNVTVVPMETQPEGNSRKEIDWKALQHFEKTPGEIEAQTHSLKFAQAIIIRAYAKGYLPGETGQLNPDGRGPYTIGLTRAAKTHQVKIVRAGDGSPVEGARLVLIPADRGGTMNIGGDEAIGFASNAWIAITDAAGIAEIALPVETYRGAAGTDEGYVWFTNSTGGDQTALLHPWASITVTIDGVQRDPNNPNPPNAALQFDIGRGSWLSPGYRAEKLKAGDTATLERLIEGDYSIEFAQPNAKYTNSSHVHLGRAKLLPGDHKDFRYSIEQNSIAGIMVAPPGLIPPQMKFWESQQVVNGNAPLFVWAQGTLVPILNTPFPMPKEIDSWDVERVKYFKEHWKEAPEHKDYLAALEPTMSRTGGSSFKVDADGSFRVDSLPAGEYEFSAFGAVEYLDPKKRLDLQTSRVVKVEKGRALQLGILLFSTRGGGLPTGTRAPNLDCPALNMQGRIQMADYKGKVVLLHIWQSDYQPSVESMSQLSKLREEFSATGRFEIVSLSQDTHAIDAYLHVRQQNYTWPQGFIGPGSLSTVKIDYQKPSKAKLIVIDAGGRIAGSNLTLEEARQVIQQTLTLRISLPPSAIEQP